MGSSIKRTSRAPHSCALCRIALRSTAVERHGTLMITKGLGRSKVFSCTLPMKCWSICLVTSNSAMTPSFNGRMALMFAGVRPSMRFASRPTAMTRWFCPFCTR